MYTILEVAMSHSLQISMLEQKDHLAAEVQQLIDDCLEQGKITHADHYDRSENLYHADLPIGSLFRVRDHFAEILQS